MTQRITFTDYERKELQRYLDAILTTGRKDDFTKWALKQPSLSLRHYDRIKSAYRDWLCFNLF